MTKNKTVQQRREFIEERDFYFENGLMILTAYYLRMRGYCCGNGCRNCPYEEKDSSKLKQING